ncbi:MAG: TonB-dependent receptor [Alistipes sp.]
MKLTTTRSWYFTTLLMGFFLCLFVVPLQAQDNQSVVVTGVISDSNNQPLVGASVVERGTTNGTTSAADGSYSLSVKKNATLDFSFIGYKTKSELVNNRTTINPSLEDDATMISEVVAIGYGSQRKEDLSMAVTTVKLDEVSKSRSSNLATMLQGRMPGVTVAQSGDPLKKASFSIRGRGSKGKDNDPTSGDGVLVVVDGIPNAPYMIEDVESITVLKDAASASIYGASVGSSGVILITTKKAQEGKMKVDVNVAVGVEKASNLPTMLNAQQFCDTWALAAKNSSNNFLPSLANPAVYSGANITQTNWLDEIFRTGLTQHYGISLSGGSEKLQSVFSLSYDKKDGVILNTNSKSVGAKLFTNYKINKWLSLSERVSFDYSNGQGGVNISHTGPIMGAMWFPSSASVWEQSKEGEPVYNDDGDRLYGGTSPMYADGVEGPNIINPVAQLKYLNNKHPRTQVFSTTTLEVKPVRGLSLKSDFTIDMDNREDQDFYGLMPLAKNPTKTSLMEQTEAKNYHYLWETIATYAEVFGRHHISAMIGFTTDYGKYHNRAFSTEGYSNNNDHEHVWDGADKWTRNPTELIYEQTMVSFLTRVGYSFADRYFLVASARRDASSKLPSTKNYDWFPSVSGSWKLSSEKFFQNLGIDNTLNLVKFRAGWGKVGNVDLYPQSVTNIPLSTYENPIILGKFEHYGTYFSTVPNFNARWETTEQTSVGLDLGLFHNSLEISADYYHKETKDLVDKLAISEQVGLNEAPMGNMGHVINKGWEFSVNYNGSAAQGKLNYTAWAMFSTNKGYVKDYGPRKEDIEHTSPNVDSKALLYSAAGQPWYSFKVYPTAGIFRTEDQINKHIAKDPKTGEAKLLQPDAKVGDLIFVDSNGDGIISEGDRRFSGSYAPKQTYSFGGSLNWKGLDFSLFFQGVAGNKVYNGMKQLAMNGRQDNGNLISDVLDTWDYNNAGSEYPRLGLKEDRNGNYLKFTDIFLEKGDYLRLKNITIGYTLPKNISRYVGLEKGSLRIYFSVDNVATITGYSGIDPEVGNYGVDSGVYPLTRFFNFGANINF